jgi:hypothetical protein
MIKSFAAARQMMLQLKIATMGLNGTPKQGKVP